MQTIDQRRQVWASQPPFADLRLVHFTSRAECARALSAAGLSVSPSKIGHWERCQDLPTRDQLPVVARVLGVSEDEVIGAFVATMTAAGRTLPGVHWAPDIWFAPCALLLGAEWMAQREAEKRLERDLAALRRPVRDTRSPIERMIDQACGLE